MTSQESEEAFAVESEEAFAVEESDVSGGGDNEAAAVEGQPKQKKQRIAKVYDVCLFGAGERTMSIMLLGMVEVAVAAANAPVICIGSARALPSVEATFNSTHYTKIPVPLPLPR